MPRFATVLFASILLLAFAGIVQASAPGVFLDGNRLYCDVPPVIKEGRVLVPVRAIFEALGAGVEWDDAARTVTARKEYTEVRLVIGGEASVNGQPVFLDVPAMIIESRTMVPLRFIGEALGCLVNWHEEDRTVYVFSPSPVNDLPLMETPKSLAVGKKGSTVSRLLMGSYLTTYGVEIVNPNHFLAAKCADITINFFDQRGDIIKTVTEQYFHIPPGATALVGDKIFTSFPTASMSVQVDEISWDRNGRQIPLFSFFDLKYNSTGDFPYDGEITGFIGNPYSRDLKNVQVNYVLYDAASEILGGGFTFVNQLSSRGTASFTDYVQGGLQAAVVKAYAVVPVQMDPHL
jgi:hypothetical protein